MAKKSITLGIFFSTCALLVVSHAASAQEQSFDLLVKYHTDPSVHLVTSASYRGMVTKWSELALNPGVEYVEPNSHYQAVAVPNDPLYSVEWGLPLTRAESAWDTQTGSSGIVIAVIDSGVQVSHPDLAANVWTNTGEIPSNGIDDDANGFIDDVNGWDFVNASPNPEPKFAQGWTSTGINHGTVVAGVAGAVGNNGIGVTGVSWNVKIMAIKALEDSGSGSTLDVARGVRYALENGADIINLSFIGSDPSITLSEAISDAWKRGVVVLAAAGNDDINLDVMPQYPVCDSDVIGVGATDSNDQKAVFPGGKGSNYGSCVDISAPGLNISSTVVYAPSQGLDAEYASGWYGTSVATPFVSGAVALALSQNAELSPQDVLNALKSTSVSLDAANPDYVGKLGGRIDVAGLVLGNQVNTFADYIVTGTEAGAAPYVRTFDSTGSSISSFYAFDQNFRGGIHVATGDLNGDGLAEIIVGAGNGGGPHIRIFSSHGDLLGAFFAYDSRFRGGVNVAVGDINGDGRAEIIAGAGNGGGPHIRIFNDKGTLLGSFFAYDPRFRGGVNVAAGDLSGDGTAEIIAGAGNGGGPHIRIFNDKGTLLGSFFAYDPRFRGGVNVAAGDVDGNGTAEIIAGAGNGGGPHVRIFSSKGILQGSFFAYNSKFRGGVRVGTGDTDRDGRDDIITGAGPGGGPQVRIFSDTGTVLGQFFAYDQGLRTGIEVSGLSR